MDVIRKKQLKIEKASEELVLPPEQTNLGYHYAGGSNVATDEEVKQISKLFLTRNQSAYKLLSIKCIK